MRTLPALLLAIPLALAGCVSTPAADLDAAAADVAAAAVPETTMPFTFEGSFGPGVWACPVVTCEGIDPMSSTYSELKTDATLTGVMLTMTWDATAPQMERMYLGISWGEDDMEYVEGSSPLVLELSELSIKPGDTPGVFAWPVSPVPMGFASAHAPQDFSIEGTLTTVTADAPAAVTAS